LTLRHREIEKQSENSEMPRGGKRDNAGRKKGQRNKGTQEVRDLIDSNVDLKRMVVTLRDIAIDVEAPPAARAVAANSLLDRRFGKAPQAITGANGGPLAIVGALGTMTDDQVQELIAQLGEDAGDE
jgi:hypothetical protein